jgi:hypothetical protein
MAGVASVLSNSGEDFVDELASLVVYDEGSKVFKKIKEGLGLNPDESKIDEALEGALSTLQYGLMNMVIVLVTEYALTKSIVVLTTIFAYIKTRRIIKNMINAVTNLPLLKLNPVGYVAGTALNKASDILIANQTETLALAKMANSSSNNIISSIGQERQNQIMIQGQKLKRVESAKSNIYGVRNKSREKNMELYLHKFEKGLWKNTQKDKQLYFDCVGQNADTVSFTTEYVKTLNSYSSVVVTAKGEIFSNAKASLDLLTQMGAKL